MITRNIILVTNFLLCLFLFPFALQSQSFCELKNEKQVSIQFIENHGQITDEKGRSVSDVLFNAEANGADIYLTTKGLTYVFTKSSKRGASIDSIDYSYYRFDINLKAASIKKDNVLRELPSSAEYNFYYPQCKKGITSAKKYGRVTVKNVYAGIDWVLYSTGKGLKYDFVVHPGANPNDIRLQYASADEINLNKAGSILLKSAFVNYSDERPIAFTKESSAAIPCNYKIKSKLKKTFSDNVYYETEIGFETEKYSSDQTLVIDPLQLWWGTYFGGNSDSEGNAVATDSTGNLYILGRTNSTTFPLMTYGTAAYFQGTYAGNNNGGGFGDVFISKFTNSGQLLWSTYFGGSNIDKGIDIKCDSLGNIFILGETYSVNLPLKNPGNGAYCDTTNGTGDWLSDFFIAKFSSTGQYLWGTYYGGDERDYPKALSIDANNNVYCAGYTWSPNFPVFNPGGGAFFQGTFGSGFGNISECAILKFSNTGQRLLATFFAGNTSEEIWSCASDKLGNTYFCGKTNSTDLLTLNPGGGAFFQGSLTAFSSSNGFILKLNSNSQAVWSTYIGNFNAFGTDLICDQNNNLFMTSYTLNGFPVIDPGGGAYYSANGFNSFLALSKFNSSSQITWSTYFGTWGCNGIGANLSIGTCNEVYLTYPVNGTCTSCPPAQIVNPGSSAFYDGSYDNSLNTTTPDFFIAAFTNSGIQKWGTFFGGQGNDQSMNHTCDKFGNIIYTGSQGWSGYQNWAGVQTYITDCITDPGNGAYFQDTIPRPFPAGGFYAVIGKFTTPKPPVSYFKTGCKINDTLSILPNGFGPYTYQWSNGATTASITSAPAGLYSFTVTDGFFGCNTEQSFFLGTPTVVASTNSTITCKGIPVNLFAQGTISYSWVPASTLNSPTGSSVSATPTINTTFTVTGSSGLNCIDEDTLTITVKPLPVISVSGNDSICNGQSSLLTSSGAINFTWSPGTNLNSVNTASTIANPSQTIIYTAIGQGTNSCIDSTKFQLNVIQYPQINVSGSFSICPGQSSTLVAIGADYFTWYSNTVIISSSPGIVLTPSISQNYTVTALNLPSCITSSIVALTIFDKPLLAVTGPDSSCVDIEFQMFVQGNGSFNWTSLNAMSCTQCADPVTTLSETGYYYVTITDNNNCQNNDSLYIKRTDYCDNELIIPNVFTPNNDNANDQFYIRSSKNVKEFNMIIYNRWGTKLFESDKIERRWDGRTDSGEKLSDGVYYYILNAKLLSGRVLNLSGTVTLLN